MKNPTKTIEAAARTKIYTALFGRQEHTFNGQGKRPNLPELDSTRRLPYHWTLADAKDTWEHNKAAANFTPARTEYLENRLHNLRNHKIEG